jgi:hypothetical protein
LPRGRGGFGRGYGYFGPRFGRGIGSGWFGWGRGFGNPYPFCRWFPWLPRRWWAYPAYGLPYTGYYSPYYGQYAPNPYMTPYPYPQY